MKLCLLSKRVSCETSEFEFIRKHKKSGCRTREGSILIKKSFKKKYGSKLGEIIERLRLYDRVYKRNPVY